HDLSKEGTGLGLPLAKRLMEMHGGWLMLDSDPGRGTTVSVGFPPIRCRPEPAVEPRAVLEAAAG
ncbi:MAG: ATP-binding protein, partial [Pseudomonadota bacterium]